MGRNNRLDIKNLTPLQQLLIDDFLNYENQIGQPVSENVWAASLGESPANLNAYKNGTRRPSFGKTIELSMTRLGPAVLAACGYPPVAITKNSKLIYMIRHWDDEGVEEVREIAYEHFKEAVTEAEKKRLEAERKRSKKEGDGGDQQLNPGQA